MSGHNTSQHMYEGPFLVPDPGDAGTIDINRYGELVELVSVGADETRTLRAPPKAGILAILRMKTDGGDVIVTASNGLNVALNDTAIFADVGDQLVLLSVAATTGYRWEILVNTGSVAVDEAGTTAAPTTAAPTTAAPTTAAPTTAAPTTAAPTTPH